MAKNLKRRAFLGAAGAAELARLLPAEREIEFTTEPDRLMALAAQYGKNSPRPSVQAALSGAEREAVVTALALEVNRLQENDKRRLDRYEKACGAYLREFRRLNLSEKSLPEAHDHIVRLALQLLPEKPPPLEG